MPQSAGTRLFAACLDGFEGQVETRNAPGQTPRAASRVLAPVSDAAAAGNDPATGARQIFIRLVVQASLTRDVQVSRHAGNRADRERVDRRMANPRVDSPDNAALSRKGFDHA